MIVSQTPYRVSLGGGGINLPAFGRRPLEIARSGARRQPEGYAS